MGRNEDERKGWSQEGDGEKDGKRNQRIDEGQVKEKREKRKRKRRRKREGKRVPRERKGRRVRYIPIEFVDKLDRLERGDKHNSTSLPTKREGEKIMKKERAKVKKLS